MRTELADLLAGAEDWFWDRFKTDPNSRKKEPVKRNLSQKERKEVKSALNNLYQRCDELFSLGEASFPITLEDLKTFLGFNFIFPNGKNTPAKVGVLVSEEESLAFTFLTRLDMNSRPIQEYEARAFGKILDILNNPKKQVYFHIGATVRRDSSDRVSGAIFWNKGTYGGKEIDPMNPSIDSKYVLPVFSSLYETVSQDPTVVSMTYRNGNKLVTTEPVGLNCFDLSKDQTYSD